MNLKKYILDTFIRYVKVDTMSKEDTNQTPSTQKQFNLAHILANELKDLGLTKEEIQTTFLEEYVFLLSEPFKGEILQIGKIFDDKADLVLLIMEKYGMEREKLLDDIINADYQDGLPYCIEDYFPLS